MAKKEENLYLHFDIDGTWSVQDMLQILSTIKALYDLRLLITDFDENVKKIAYMLYRSGAEGDHLAHYYQARKFFSTIDAAQLAQASKAIYPNDQLVLKRIHHCCPGFIEFEGIDQILNELYEWIKIITPIIIRKLKKEQKPEGKKQKWKKEKQELEKVIEIILIKVNWPPQEMEIITEHFCKHLRIISKFCEDGRLKEVLVIGTNGEITTEEMMRKSRMKIYQNTISLEDIQREKDKR
jgi:hypothetical protein